MKIEEVIILPYAARKDCKTFLKYMKADINEATSDSIIPKHIRMDCYNRFKTIDNFDIPDICGKVEHTKVFIGLDEPLIN